MPKVGYLIFDYSSEGQLQANRYAKRHGLKVESVPKIDIVIKDGSETKSKDVNVTSSPISRNAAASESCGESKSLSK